MAAQTALTEKRLLAVHPIHDGANQFGSAFTTKRLAELYHAPWRSESRFQFAVHGERCEHIVEVERELRQQRVVEKFEPVKKRELRHGPAVLCDDAQKRRGVPNGLTILHFPEPDRQHVTKRFQKYKRVEHLQAKTFCDSDTPGTLNCRIDRWMASACWSTSTSRLTKSAAPMASLFVSGFATHCCISSNLASWSSPIELQSSAARNVGQ